MLYSLQVLRQPVKKQPRLKFSPNGDIRNSVAAKVKKFKRITEIGVFGLSRKTTALPQSKVV
jgi:hypothetical protein